MKAFKVSFLLLSVGLLALSPSSFAQDKDDDINPIDLDRIAFAESLDAAGRAQLEAQYPKEAQEVRVFIASHIEHANTKALEAYIGDFHAPRYRYPELELKYAQRVMNLPDLRLEVRSIEIVILQPRAATLHVRQVASYTDEASRTRVDEAIISYRLQKNNEDDRWVILATDRKRLVSK